MNFYNEVDLFAAQWLQNLSDAGHIARGRIDVRSIKEVQFFDIPDGQAHFFAGVGVWSRALRLAGWPDDVSVWTGSCPCQPFSQAGKRKGTDDDRHLWPEWFRLIKECRPPVIFGEQVASPDGLKWLDTVSADLEGEGYAFGAADISAAGVGAPHIRQRLYFVAYAGPERLHGVNSLLHGSRAGRRDAPVRIEVAGGGEAGVVVDAERGAAERRRFNMGTAARAAAGAAQERQRVRDDARDGGDTGGVAHSDKRAGRQGGALGDGGHLGGDADEGTGLSGGGGLGELGDSDDAGPQGRGLGRDGAHQRVAGAAGVAGFWKNADWISCRDGKWRPVEPGTFPLAHGAPARVGRLRAYGNALTAPTAAAFVSAAMDSLDLAYLLGVG